MAASAVEQAFEIALDRYPSSAALARSYERFNTWWSKYGSFSTHTTSIALQDRLSEVPGVQEGLRIALMTISFLLEKVYFETTQVEEAIAQIEQSVDKLFQISTLVDEIDSEKNYAQALQWDLYSDECAFDSAHVLDRFSHGKAEEWLIHRLGLAISHRRGYLRFRSFQAQHSQHVRAALALFPQRADEPEAPAHPGIETDVEEDIAKLIPRVEDIKLDDGQVDCPCCQKRLRFTTEGSWRSHFLADLRPYVCTSFDCSMRVFKDKAAWLSHEIEHLQDWHCPLCHDAKFQSYGSYLEHLHGFHQVVEDHDFLRNLKSKTRERIDVAECPLCDWTKLDVSCYCLLEHVAVHLEELAIYAYETKDATGQVQITSSHSQVRSIMPGLPSLLLIFLSSAITGAALLDASASRRMIHRKANSRDTGVLDPQEHGIESQRADGPHIDPIESTAWLRNNRNSGRFANVESVERSNSSMSPTPMVFDRKMNEPSRTPDRLNWHALYKGHSVLPGSNGIRAQSVVSFFFQVSGLEPNPEYDTRRDSRDRWLPPKRLGSNRPYFVPGQEVPLKLLFHHDGVTTRLLGPQDAAASKHRAGASYKTFSLYHHRGVLWTIDYDATQYKVGNGVHETDDEDDDDSDSVIDDNDASHSDSEYGEKHYDNWTELSFATTNVEGLPSLSHAGRHFSERRLLVQRRDQDWVQHLLPDRYQSHMSTTDQKAGGLVGDLPVLIALVAMSMPVQKWPELIPQTMSSRPWRISQAQLSNIDRGTQWTDRRGVVVKVLRDLQGGSEDELENFEYGTYGPIFN